MMREGRPDRSGDGIGRAAGIAIAVLIVGAACPGDPGLGSNPPPAPPPPPPPAPVVAECSSPRPEWIWCDDFEQDRLARYFEYDQAGGRFVRAPSVGVGGSFAMRASWAAGQVSVGALHLAFGRTPSSGIRPVDDGSRDYRDIYWRVYLRNDPDWVGGGGNKLSRAQILATQGWAQAMVAPVWSGSQGAALTRLMVDPASGTDPAGALRTTKYNDDANFRFLGAANSITELFVAAAVGRWYCIEARARLNDSGQSNGSFELWIDGRAEASRGGLNWVGAYSAFGINTVFLENYWNQGAPKAQSRYLDQFVVSTARIGCQAAP